jgi:hypothetical protein
MSITAEVDTANRSTDVYAHAHFVHGPPSPGTDPRQAPQLVGPPGRVRFQEEPQEDGDEVRAAATKSKAPVSSHPPNVKRSRTEAEPITYGSGIVKACCHLLQRLAVEGTVTFTLELPDAAEQEWHFYKKEGFKPLILPVATNEDLIDPRDVALRPYLDGKLRDTLMKLPDTTIINLFCRDGAGKNKIAMKWIRERGTLILEGALSVIPEINISDEDEDIQSSTSSSTNRNSGTGSGTTNLNTMDLS